MLGTLAASAEIWRRLVDNCQNAPKPFGHPESLFWRRILEYRAGLVPGDLPGTSEGIAPKRRGERINGQPLRDASARPQQNSLGVWLQPWTYASPLGVISTRPRVGRRKIRAPMKSGKDMTNRLEYRYRGGLRQVDLGQLCVERISTPSHEAIWLA